MSLETRKTRKEIQSETATREKEMKKRLSDTKQVVGDKNAEKDLARRLDLRCTSEGVDAVKKAIQAAGEATDREHRVKEEGLKKEVFEPGRQSERELAEQAGSAQADAAKTREAASKIDTAAARTQVQAAEKAAEQDGRFLTEQKETQEKNRRKGETESQKQREEIKGAKISFSR